MKLTIIFILFVVTPILVLSPAAHSIIISDSYEITSDYTGGGIPATYFDYNNSSVGLASSDVLFTVKGTNLDICHDQNFAHPSEWVKIDLNGQWDKRWGQLENTDTYDTWDPHYYPMDASFEDTITLDKAFWNSLVQEGLLLTLSWGPSVNYNAENSPDTIEWSFEYNTPAVPEPGTMLLLATGLIVLARFGRKR